MSDILEMAHDMAKDLHAVGAMDAITMRMMDELCLPKKRTFTAADIRRIRSRTRRCQHGRAMGTGQQEARRIIGALA
jgi:putative transcriptional regulator